MKKDRIINLNLRLPAQLHAFLVKEARASNRSLNGEILERLEDRVAESPRDKACEQIRPEFRGLVELVATVMDVAGHSRFGVDALYAPESVPAWIDEPSGYAVAAAAAARVLDALHPPQDATAADPGYAAALAENNRGHGKSGSELHSRKNREWSTFGPTYRFAARSARSPGRAHRVAPNASRSEGLRPGLDSTDDDRAASAARSTACQGAGVEAGRRT
jgi:Arc-like DNA binding domain